MNVNVSQPAIVRTPEQEAIRAARQAEYDAAKEPAKAIWRASHELMEYLYERWQDEKEYEDIKDYACPALQKIVEAKGGKIHKMTARPFACQFFIGNYRFEMRTTSRNHGFKSLGRWER